MLGVGSGRVERWFSSLRPLTALAENPGSVLRNHMVAVLVIFLLL